MAFRKRPRESNLGPAVVEDYRPYSSGMLDSRYWTTKRSHQNEWNCYYRNNTTNGYKDRHYILREFSELAAAIRAASSLTDSEAGIEGGSAAPSFSWMEIGCGVGNAVMPSIVAHGHLAQWKFFYGFDISNVAINLLKGKVSELPEVIQKKVRLTTLDPTQANIADNVELFHGQPAAIEFASMIFVLCSIEPGHHRLVIHRITQCLKPGAVFFFRDYAVHDHARYRFESRDGVGLGSESSRGAAVCADSPTFFRSNGTQSHFFALDEVRSLFTNAGFEVIELKVAQRTVTNRKQQVQLERRFIQGRFRFIGTSASE